jgi:hypothetical protein
MNNRDHSWQTLAVQMRRNPAAVPSGMRTELEKRLTPLIRCVLRTGAGVPALVQWVQRTLPHLPSADVEQTAPRMARLLCAELFRQGKPTDTVIGRLAADTVAGR